MNRYRYPTFERPAFPLSADLQVGQIILYEKKIMRLLNRTRGGASPGIENWGWDFQFAAEPQSKGWIADFALDRTGYEQI